MFKHFILILAVICLANSYNETNHVLQLSVADFDSAIQEFDNILVKFYAPWCGHCKKLAPEYEKAATQLNKDQSKHRLAEVDCTVHKQVCTKYQVRGYPTLKLFSKGKQPIAYGSKRTADDIVQWINKETGTPQKEKVIQTVGEGKYQIVNSVLILQDSNIAQAIEEYDNILVKFYAPWCGHCKNLAPTYIEVAQALAAQNANIKIAEVDCTKQKQACGKYEIKGYPTVIYFTQNNEPKKYPGARQKEAMINWLKQNAVKEVQEAGQPQENQKDEKVQQL